MLLHDRTPPPHPEPVAYWVTSRYGVVVMVAPANRVPARGTVLAMGAPYPSLAAAVTAVEVDRWCELSHPE